VATDRETDGLARSSRNGYLTAEEHAQAPALYRVLQATANALSEGRSDYGVLELEASQMLCQAGFRPDYVSIRRAEDLELPAEGENELVILAAAYLGKARLIDNLRLSR
jgi:pantoate--beta-alanine ligase